MKRAARLWWIPAATVLLLLVPASAIAQAPTPAVSGSSSWGPGVVFTMSNAFAGNFVIAYDIGAGGALVPAGEFSTGGTGTGSSLADQGSLVLSLDHHYLFVVNAGDNTISVFAIHPPTSHGPVLNLLGWVGSRGIEPVSLAVHDPFLYVLNAGNASTPGNIAGFVLGPHGRRAPLPGSTRPLSGSSPTGPAEIAFNPAGTVLVVTEKATSLIDTYSIDASGAARAPLVSASNGSTPYGFAFGPGGSLIVSDAGPGALSSYTIARNGVLTVVSGSVGDGQLAPCWVAVADRYAYTSNAHSGTISAYRIG